MSTAKFLAGALVGLAAGLLLAPEKGEELRTEMADTVAKWKKKLDRMAGNTGAQLNDLKNMLGEQIEGLGDDARKRILTIIEESGDHAQNIKRSVTSEVR
jgi:gas vesicle protein